MYVGHMRPTSGTTIVDVADPAIPKTLARVDVPDGWHSHKVRVAGDIMIVNHEKFGKAARGEVGGGLGIYDVGRPSEPKLITKWPTIGGGVHRFDFDGRYAYISPTVEGYIGNIVMILDLADPAKPVEVSRWWIPGQWEAGGEPYPWADWVSPRCHHPLRYGDRLYVSYLASRPVHSRHFGSVAAQADRACQHQPGVPAPDPHLPAHSAEAARPRHHGGGRRGRGQAVAVGTLLRLGLRRDQRAHAGLDRHLAGPRHRHRRHPAAADDRLPPAVGALPRHGHSVRLVRAGPAARRFRRPVPAARGRPSSAGAGAGRGSGLLQRRHRRCARPDLPGRPHPRRRHHRNQRMIPS